MANNQVIVNEIMNYEVMSSDSCKAFFQITLPEDIKKTIFDENFSKDVIYQKKYSLLMEHITSLECQQLHHNRLKEMIKTFINDSGFISYICERNQLFSQIYHKHYVLNQKSFVLMDNLNSLALSWLMYLYH